MLAGVLALGCSVATAQTTPAYYARERGAAIARDDAAVAVAAWEDTDEGRRWFYTAGWVTENDGSGNPHKRLAVFKYDEEVDNYAQQPDPPGPGYNLWEARAFFPPGEWSPHGQHAATAMAVDADGNVYVTGYTTLEENGGTGGTDLNYITIKYDKNLAPVWSGTGWGNAVNGARGYDHSSHGDDEAVSIAVAHGPDVGEVLVTGTSSNGEDKDILTLRYNSDGSLDTNWDSEGEGAGIRRFDGGEGDDTAAEVGYFVMVVMEVPGLQTIVVGTTDNGTDTDRVVICYDHLGDSASPNGWVSYHDGGYDDVGTGLARHQPTDGETPVIFACGHSEMNGANPPDIDIVVSNINPQNGVTGQAPPSAWWTKTHDFDGAQDMAFDMAVSGYDGGQVDYIFAWVAGKAEVDGSDRVAIVCYEAAGTFYGAGSYAYVAGAGNRGNSVTASGLMCMAAGTTLSAVADPDLVVLSFYLTGGSPPSLTSNWAVRFPGDASYLPDAGLAITRGTLGHAIAAGQSTYNSGSLTDAVVFRLGQNP